MIFLVQILVGLALTPLLIGNVTTKEIAHILVATFAAIGALIVYRKKDLSLFLSPNAIVFFYTSASLAIGAWGFHNGYVLSDTYLADYHSFEHMHVTVSITLLCLTIMLVIDLQHHNRYLSLTNLHRHTFTQPYRPRISHIVALLISAPLLVTEIHLGFLGGSGDFASPLRAGWFIMLFLLVQSRNLKTRILIYTFIITIYAGFSVQDKRESIFLILPAILLELLRKRAVLNFKTITAMSTGSAVLLLLILSMSITRGYGDFGEISNLLQAIPFVFAYIGSDTFIASLLNNIEANYFFFHGFNAIESTIADPTLVSGGSTVIKPLFLPLPRDQFTWKPESMITLYTEHHFPAFRAAGGSYPINLVSELFWNFYYGAPIAVIPLALLFARTHITTLKATRSQSPWIFAAMMFLNMHILTLTRGSGFDQFLANLIFTGTFFALLASFSALINSARYSKLGNCNKVHSSQPTG